MFQLSVIGRNLRNSIEQNEGKYETEIKLMKERLREQLNSSVSSELFGQTVTKFHSLAKYFLKIKVFYLQIETVEGTLRRQRDQFESELKDLKEQLKQLTNFVTKDEFNDQVRPIFLFVQVKS